MKRISTLKGNTTIAVLLTAVLAVGITFVAISEYRGAHEAVNKVTTERLEAAVASVEQLKADQEALGATNKIPDLRALYEDTLASKITNTATSFTLVRGTSAGVALASSTYPFIIDEGTAIEEMVLADCTGTTCTNVTRGLSFTTGTTTVNALRFAHGRGASVKITDGPVLLIHNRLLQGVDTFPNLLSYEATTLCNSLTSDSKICDVGYIRNIAGQGAATSTETRGGLVELATKLEQASSTDLGADQPLALQAKYATSTSNGVISALYTIVANNLGKLDLSWLTTLFSNNNTWTGTNTFTNTATFSGGVTGLINVWGDGSDGSATISSPTTLTRDMYYTDLVVTDTLTTNGFRIYVSGTLSGAGTIKSVTASNGSNGSGSTGGVGGATTTPRGTLGWSGKGGTGGAGAGPGAGSVGLSGANTFGPSIGRSGGNGGAGGNDNSTNPGGAGGTSPTPTATTTRTVASLYSVSQFTDFASSTSLFNGLPMRVPLGGSSGGSGGGGGGAVSGDAVSGGGGGGGASALPLYIAAKTWAGTFTLGAAGGNGGNGANGVGTGGTAGGGGGGGGGNGSDIWVIYQTKTWSGSYSNAGGTAGSGGTPFGIGASGTAGTAGKTGSRYELDIATLTSIF